jgi:hypothetical protein
MHALILLDLFAYVIRVARIEKPADPSAITDPFSAMKGKY